MRVVLKRRLGALAHFEVALLAAQPPEDLAALAIELVQGPRVAGTDDDVAVLRFGRRINVEIVEGGGWALLAGREVRLVECDVVEAVPFKQYPASGELDLLDDAVHDGAVFRAAGRAGIPPDGVVRADEGGIARCDSELVQIGAGVAVADPDAGDHLVGLVADHPVAPVLLAGPDPLPPRQHRLTLVRLNAEIEDLLHADLGRVEPDDLSFVVENHGAVLPGAPLRTQKEMAGRGAILAVLDFDTRRRQVRAGPERPRLLRIDGLGDIALDIQREGRGDSEIEHTVRGAQEIELGADRDLLAGLERKVWHEAHTLPVRMRQQHAGMETGLRSGHLDRTELVRERAAETDLR